MSSSSSSFTRVSALGNTVPEVDLQSLGYLHLGTVEKSLFSMATPEVLAYFQHHNFKSIIVVGIEVGLPPDGNFHGRNDLMTRLRRPTYVCLSHVLILYHSAMMCT